MAIEAENFIEAVMEEHDGVICVPERQIEIDVEIKHLMEAALTWQDDAGKIDQR